MTESPKCKTCNHPVTFHGTGTTPCKALGCQCKKWRGPKFVSSKGGEK